VSAPPSTSSKLSDASLPDDEPAGEAAYQPAIASAGSRRISDSIVSPGSAPTGTRLRSRP